MSETKTDTATRHITVPCQFCDSWNRVDAARVADRPIHLGDETFARAIAESEVPVLVDFYADWCGPCKMMAPSVDDIAGRYQGRALVAKVDTDRAQRVAMQFGIRGIPTTIVFKDGKEVGRQTGAVPAPALEALLTKAL